MDRAYIDSHDIVDRYLSGDLLVREAREFEKYCLEHPDLLAQLPIPVRLKARLARRPLEDSETGVFPAIPSTTTLAAVEMAPTPEDDLAAPASYGPTRKQWIFGGVAAAIIVAGGLVWHFSAIEALEDRVATLTRTAETARLRAPTGVQSYRITPDRQGPQSAANLNIGWPDPPQLLELRINVTEIRFNAFALTIEKVGEARVMQIRRIAPDSNRELRLALNSSAFGPGQYRLQLEGYTWRGELVEAGWMNLDLE